MSIADSCLVGMEQKKFFFTLDEALSQISNWISLRNSKVVLSINLHAISLMRQDREFHAVYEKADKIRFDGMSAILLARLSGGKSIEKIGADVLMKGLYPMVKHEGWTLYLLGGPEGVWERATKNIRSRFPGLNIVGTNHGYFNAKEERKIIKKINELSPDILLVSLGMPRQEKWIHRNRYKLKVGVIISCGGYIEQTANYSIDYYPDWAYKYNLNWFYRVLKNPRALWKRYFFEGITFVFYLLPKYLLKGKNWNQHNI